MYKTETTDDDRLIYLFKNGDQSAFERLISLYKDKVYTYIFLIVRDKHLADDVFQDTFVKVIRSIKTGRYTENGKFLSWVIRIAHNLIIDHFRKERLLGTVVNDDFDAFGSAWFSDENVEEQLIQDQISKDIRYLIDKLPEDQRHVIILRHYQGLSFKEIADHLDISVNTALGRMRYALINLRKIIEKKRLVLTKM